MIRKLRPADNAKVRDLMAAERPGGLVLSVEDYYRNTIHAVRYDSTKNAVCVMQHYALTSPTTHLPFSREATHERPVWISQVTELLPQQEGLMTDGTHGRLALETLKVLKREHSEAGPRPLYGMLPDVPGTGRDKRSVVEKWRDLVGGTIVRLVDQDGNEYPRDTEGLTAPIWFVSLDDTIARLGAALGG